MRDIKHSALSTFPTVASMRHGGGFRPPADAARVPGGGSSTRFEKRGNRFSNRAHEAEQPVEPQDEGQGPEEQQSEDAS